MRKIVNPALAITLVFSSTLAAGENIGPAPIERGSKRVVLKNVELSEGGNLPGQLLNKSGQALPNVEFVIEQKDKVHRVLTGTDGKFDAAGLKSGQCVFRVEDDVFACRVWKRGTAPPNSLTTFALVASKDVVRGQFGIPLPPLPLPAIPLPAIPIPSLPHFGAAGGLGGGSMMGITLLAVGGGAIAIAAANDSSSSSPDASL